MNKKIFFCFPYKKVGGVSMVFLRLSKELSENGYDCYLIDYFDGYMAKHIDSNVSFLEYHDKKMTNIPDNSIVIFQSMSPWSIFPNLNINPNAKIVFWNCHPFNLVPTMPGVRSFMQSNHILGKYVLKTILRSYRNIVIKFINHLSKTNALFFMDNTNLKTTQKYLDIFIKSPTILPIPLKKKSTKFQYKPNELNKKIKIAWIGRVVDFKFFILKKALSDIDKIVRKDKDIKIEFTIIGEGEKRLDLINYIKKLKNISIRLIDYINPDDIESFLLEEIDLLMAMGTSALEGARIGIPTILLDMAYNEIDEGYNYQWISKRDGFTLGDVINQEHYTSEKNPLRSRLNELIEDSKYLSTQARDYYNENHSIESVSKKFIRLIFESNCTWKSLQDLKVIERGYFYNAFTKLRGISKSS